MRPKKNGLTRRDLIKRFGALAFALTPVARAMGYVAGGAFGGAPRFVMFFKGAGYQSESVRPASIDDLDGTPLAPLMPHAADIVLFRGMHIHGGSPKSPDYHEEHGAGLFGCVTGHEVRYYDNDSYMAYTDHPSIDIAIAEHYRAQPALAALPFSSLHIGAGAHSDSDGSGLGQRYISFRRRRAGESAYYANAIVPIQDAGTVYDTMMMRINAICSADSSRPATDSAALVAALRRRKSVLDFHLADVADAQRELGMDSEHARKLDGLLDGWRSIETTLDAELAALEAGETGGATSYACPSMPRPTGDGEGLLDLDRLSPVHDQMIALTKLAFEWDLTRVVAFTLSGASCGQRWPSAGVREAHHSLEHGGDTAQLDVVDRYYSEKLADLLAALKTIDDGDGHHGLYNSSIVLGTECWSNHGHYLEDVPFVLAGSGAGAWETGRVVDCGGRSNNDLLLSCMRASGMTAETFGLASLCRGPIV